MSALERHFPSPGLLPLALSALAFTGPLLSGQNGWTQAHPPQSPPARAGHAMAYDSARGRTVLFGGYEYSSGHFKIFSDTWEWDGKNWIRMHPAQSPPPRYCHAMAYDSARRRTVLFGGYGKSGYLSDTWEWDGKTWARIQPLQSPTPRRDHAMAYDSARRRTVLFGGHGKSGFLFDTWEWDGKNWIQMHPAQSPPPRDQHAMAYDSARGRIVLFGGYFYSSGKENYFSDTWEWDGKIWIQLHPAQSPPARAYHAMAYDSARRRTVLFGGASFSRYFSDTWELVFSPPTFKTYGQGCPGSNKLVPLLQARTLPRLGENFILELKNAPILTWTFLALGLQATNFSLAPYGAPGCALFTNPDFVFPNSTNLTGAWSLPHQFKIPGDANLLGGAVHMQVLLADRRANKLGLTVSNAAKATIGF